LKTSLKPQTYVGRLVTTRTPRLSHRFIAQKRESTPSLLHRE
jgi:hypothetical protein